MPLIKAIAIAACHSKLQSVLYDVCKRLLQLASHCSGSISDVVRCKQTFLIVRQLKYVAACVCLQQKDRGSLEHMDAVAMSRLSQVQNTIGPETLAD